MTKFLSSLSERVDPGLAAIVVVDMQNDFCAEGGYVHKTKGADMSANVAIAANIMELVEVGRAVGMAVVWIQANYEPRFLSGQALAKRAEKGIEAICCEGGTWGWTFFGVEPRDDEIFIEKHTYSAFAGTELDRILRFRGIQTLVMTGVATNVCVESTLRDGFFNGYYIVLPEDCVGSSAQNLHDATIANVRATFGEVTSLAKLTAILAGQPKLATG